MLKLTFLDVLLASLARVQVPVRKVRVTVLITAPISPSPEYRQFPGTSDGVSA